MMTDELVRLAGLEALLRELGPIGMICFWQQFETVSGDYSKERHLWLGDEDVATLARQIRENREGKDTFR
jgi:hypothetical protein